MTGHHDIRSIEDLYYRRQFLLGPAYISPTPRWRHFPLQQNLCLSVHPNLSVVVESQNTATVVLLGLAVHPLFPGYSLADLARSLTEGGPEFESVIDRTRAFCGRWIVIYQSTDDTYLFTDPFGFRQVYYHWRDGVTWCGSQPEIIRAATELTVHAEPATLDFLLSPEFSRTESAWVGPQTIYADCDHLMPNHYLDVHRRTPVRFYPAPGAVRKTQTAVLEDAVRLLEGTYEAITTNGKIAQALTAGWDSRILLAASRRFSSRLHYFVDRMGVLAERDPDVWVPQRLARRLKLDFAVRCSAEDPPGWFVSVLARNVTGARILPKTRMIYARLKGGGESLKINGNGGELCRNYFDKYARIPDQRRLDVSDLCRRLDYTGREYVEREIRAWRDSLPDGTGREGRVLDLLYWEQRLGNWGAQYPAEQDVAVDEISPFCNRLLIETLLAAPPETRRAPDYPLYRELIRAMWPEALAVPINPVNRGPMAALRARLRRFVR